jgi:hypothetical protein
VVAFQKAYFQPGRAIITSSATSLRKAKAAVEKGLAAWAKAVRSRRSIIRSCLSSAREDLSRRQAGRGAVSL